MGLLVHIADRALNRPLLITPEKAAVILQVLSGRIGVDAGGLAPEASRFVGTNYPEDEGGRARFTPFKATRDGVGIITITGSLVNRGAWIGANSGLTSYEGIKYQIASAKADKATRAVILDLSSPGGEAVGAFEVAQAVRELAAEKRVVAVVNGMAASAAYAIASGASEIVTTETGVSGSIGVVLLHADYSEQLAGEGVKPTLIFAGAHKVDGNPFEPLSKSVRADMQAEIDAFYEKFLTTVAKGRGARLDAEGARKTEARTFIGEAAVEAGLADRVGTFESVLAELSSRPVTGAGATLTRGSSMSEITGAPAADHAGISQAHHESAVAGARAEGFKAGREQERSRIAAIAGSEGIKGHGPRLAAALDLAAKAPDMAAADVAAFVTASVPAGVDLGALADRENPANALGVAPAPAAQDASVGWKSAAAAINARNA